MVSECREKINGAGRSWSSVQGASESCDGAVGELRTDADVVLGTHLVAFAKLLESAELSASWQQVPRCRSAEMVHLLS